MLQTYVSQLRKALGRDAIATRGRGYVAAVAEGALDLRVFERRASAGRAGARRGALWRCRRGVPRRAGAVARAGARGSRRRAMRADGRGAPGRAAPGAALERAIDADLACGRDAELVAELEALVARHPLHERFRAQQMVALYRCGRQADALEAFQRARGTLVAELGIEPGAALRDVQRAILEQDPALASTRSRSSASAPIADDPRRVMTAAFADRFAAGLGRARRASWPANRNASSSSPRSVASAAELGGAVRVWAERPRPAGRGGGDGPHGGVHVGHTRP